MGVMARRCGRVRLVDSCTFIGARGAGYGYGIGQVPFQTLPRLPSQVHLRPMPGVCGWRRAHLLLPCSGLLVRFRCRGMCPLQRHDRSASRYFGETAVSVVGCDFHSAEDVIRHPYPATPRGNVHNRQPILLGRVRRSARPSDMVR